MTPVLSEALAETVTEPITELPGAGAVSVIVGGVVSGGGEDDWSVHSRAVVPAHDASCGVPLPFLSVTSPGRGSGLRYQMRVWPAGGGLGGVVFRWGRALQGRPE